LDKALVGSRINIWTIGSISVVAYCLANILHEGLGHGGACFLMGGTPQQFNAIFFVCDSNSISSSGQRVIAAGGGVVNFITGIMALIILHFFKLRENSISFFFWLFSAVSILMSFGYILFSGISGAGDWIKVFHGLASNYTVRLSLILLGAFLYFVISPKLLFPKFKSYLNSSYSLNSQLVSLVRLPYIIGGTTFLIAGLLNPYGFKLVISSAIGASFGGTSLLAWYRISPNHSSTHIPATPFYLEFSKIWLAVGLITLIVFVGVLGPGIEGRPLTERNPPEHA